MKEDEENSKTGFFKNPLIVTLYTLLIGALGAYTAYLLSFPVYLLTGPAIVVSIAGLLGVHLHIDHRFRDAVFLLIGISIGAGVTSEATAAVVRWPVAFVVLCAMLVLAMLICCWLLKSRFGFDKPSAVLAASPGHLGFVLSLGLGLSVDMTRISLVQTVRVLALTVLVPFVAWALGISFDGPIVIPGPIMPFAITLLIVGLSVALGLVFKRVGVPAPLLIGGMVISTLFHATETVQGNFPPMVVMACFMTIGTLIGSRFSGVTIDQVRQYALAGLSTTLITLALAMLAALPIAWFLGIPIAHVIVAFAPGGLETMIAMGAVVGANPGFVAACHVGRLLFLTVLVPVMIGNK